MRPDLRKRSAAAAAAAAAAQSPVRSGTDSLAVVLHRDHSAAVDAIPAGSGLAGFHPVLTDSHQALKSPHDLIRDEALATLIQQVCELRQRCDSLEETNAGLKCDLDDIKRAQLAAVTDLDIHAPDMYPYKSLNLSGYPISEASTSSKTAAPGTAISGEELQAFKNVVEDKVQTMTAILEAFKSDLNEEGVKRYRLGQDLERAKHDATKTKGRVGTIEVQTKEVRIDLENLADAASLRDGEPDAARPSDKVQRQLDTALTELDDLSIEVKRLAGLADGSQLRPAGAPHTTSKQRRLAASDHADHNSIVKSESQAADLTIIQIALHRMMLKAEMQQRIDDLASKDQLHIVFNQLSRSLDAASPGDEGLVADTFSGTYDELWSLRDRVIRRLAMIDKYDDALQEAKQAAIYL